MTVIGLDDTDSRRRGQCTTYVASSLADRVEESGGSVDRVLLVRCNPAVEHKTRGNAALAIHCDLDADRALSLAENALDDAEVDDPKTNPGAVVADCDPGDVPESVATFARSAVRDLLDRDRATALVEDAGFETATRGNGRGIIGALAAVGAWRAFDEWTYEHIAYREPSRWGTDREVAHESVIAAANRGYPAVWDTVDRVEDAAVCVPRTPCPVLFGIRGDDPESVEAVAANIASEPVASRRTFVTNQGTDAHLQPASVDAAEPGGSYRVSGDVVEAPETREGGHVFLKLRGDGATLRCAAFEPTKRFRDRVRDLRVGDRITACGEVSDGTLKLEKFAARDLVTAELATPECPKCGRSMASAGADQGYRCRDCKTTAEGKVRRSVDRTLEPGWYEVPPCARRHVAKPLVRGGFDAPTHPER